MGVLNLIDVSPVLHTAFNVPELNKQVVRGCPVGGMQLLMRKISYFLMRGENVICVFDSKTDRKIKNPNYKSGRKRIPEIVLQNEALQEFLMNSGISCAKVNGLEADDVIYNLVESNLNNFDVINIYSSDYDLCHNVRSGKVNFFTVNSLTLNVNGNNFCEVLSDNNLLIPYNMITASKVFCGDSSDGIGSFVSESGISGSELFKAYVDLLFNNKLTDFEILRSRNTIEKLIPFLNLSSSDIEVIKDRCDLFYPIERSVDFSPSNLATVNYEYYCGFVKSIKDLDSCKTLKYFGEPNSSVDDKLFSYGNSFRSGEFHVDKDLSLEDFSLSSSSVFIRGL